MAITLIIAAVMIVMMITLKIVEIIMNLKSISKPEFQNMYLDYEYGEHEWYCNMFKKIICFIYKKSGQ